LYSIVFVGHSYWHLRQSIHSAESTFSAAKFIAAVGQISSQKPHWVQFLEKENLKSENLDRKAKIPPKGHRLRHQNLGAINSRPIIAMKIIKPIMVSV